MSNNPPPQSSAETISSLHAFNQIRPSTSASPKSPLSAAWLIGGVAVLDGENRVVSMNDALVAWLARPRAGLIGSPVTAELAKVNPEWETPLQRLLCSGAVFDRLELPASGTAGRMDLELTSHGGVKVLRLESVPPVVREFSELLPDEAWTRLATNGLWQRLQRAEAQLENLTHRWPGIIFSQRPDFSFLFVSPRIESLTGIPVEEWRRSSAFFWQVVHEADAHALQHRLKHVRESADGISSTYRVRNVRTGRVSYLWEHRQAVYSSGLLLGYEGMWLDITRQTVAERRLVSMSWKENLGTLTMGLAHDFCNIMTGIVALSQTFEQQFAQQEGLRDGLGMIRNSALQASELAQRIRQLHQGTPGEKNYHDLNEIIANMSALLDKVLTRRVKVKSVAEPGQLPVYVDAVELQQVVINLALNAVDAMPEGGTLTLKTARHEQAPDGSPMQGSFPRAPLVCLTVADTGAGIPTEYLNSIFDPYFTTKPLGKGSGLGLYNARLFAENHGAAITVDTTPQSGTVFHLWFPQSDFTEAQQASAAAHLEPRTLLVVGASRENRDHAVELLRANRFYALAANSVPEAMDILRSPDFQLSAVLVLARRADAPELAVLQRIRSEMLPVKAFLCPMGLNQDEFSAALVAGVNATLPHELPAAELVARLNTLLEVEAR